MPINYADPLGSADTGYNDEDSIQPVENGESAMQTVFQRPSENLRDRTEVVRTALDDNFLTNMSDRGIILAGTGNVQVTWNGPNSGAGDGKFSLNTSGQIWIVPVVSPADYNARSDIFARLSYKIGTDSYFTVRSRGDHTTPVRAYNGANNIKLELFYEAGVVLPSDDPVVTVSGSKNAGGDYDPASGPVLVSVQLSHDTAIRSTWAQVVTQVNAHAEAGEWIRAFVETGGGGSLAVVIDEQFLWEGVGTDVSGIGALDSQTFRVTKAEIDNFFSVANPGEDGMDNGDALVIDYEAARDRLAAAGDVTVGSALRLIHRNENDLADDDDAFSSVGNAFQGNCIPLCKVISDSLYFINGTQVEKDETAYLKEDTSKLRSDLARQVTPSGSTFIGCDDIVGTVKSLSADTLHAQLGDLLGYLNSHFSGLSNKHPYKDITGKPVVQVGSASYNDYSSLDAAMTALASSGGTIYLTSDLTEDVSVGLIGNAVTIHGNGHSLIGAGGGSVFEITNLPANGPALLVDNLTIRTSNDQTVVALDDYEAENVLLFRNCRISAHSSGTTPVIKNNGSMKFVDCVVDGGAQTRDMFELSATDGANMQSLVVERCILTNCRRVMTCTGAESNLGYVAFRNNEITDGVESSGGNNRWIFDGNPTTHRFATFVLESNVAAGEGGFAKVKVRDGYGLIARNKFNSTFSEDVELHYAIDADMSLTTGDSPRRFHIEGNEIDLNGQLAGILARQYCVVAENTLYNFYHSAPSGITYHYGIFVPNGGGTVDILNNKIRGISTGLSGGGFMCIRIGESSALVGIHISGNDINVPDGYWGLYTTYAERVTVTGNTFAALTTTTLGSNIGPFSTQCTVSGNIFKLAGLSVNGEHVSVTGNSFYGSGATSGHAVEVSDDYCTVLGNVIYGWDYGIRANSSAAYVAVTGNVIYDCNRGISIEIGASAHATVNGNQVRVGSSDTGIYIENNSYVGFAGNECSGSTTLLADIDLPTVNNNIGGGQAGSASNALTLNLYGNAATH